MKRRWLLVAFLGYLMAITGSSSKAIEKDSSYRVTSRDFGTEEIRSRPIL